MIDYDNFHRSLRGFEFETELFRDRGNQRRAGGFQLLLRRPLQHEIVSPVQIPETLEVRASPSTRCPYGSAQPQTTRPSQSITRVLHGQVHPNRVDK